MHAIDLTRVLEGVVAAVEQEGRKLEAEYRRAGGPRGENKKAPIDEEIERCLRAALQALVPCAFVGEETGRTAGTLKGWYWLVDPQDGTSDFLKGIPGSAISVALMRGAEPVLGVVHSPFSPLGGSDTFAWAEGSGALRRNGIPVALSLAQGQLTADASVWVTASAARRAEFFRDRIAPAAMVAMPSIAHRLARVAAGEGVAAITIHPISEHDIAAGAAMIRAMGGVVLDAAGNPIKFTAGGQATFSGCYAGAPAAAKALAQADWSTR